MFQGRYKAVLVDKDAYLRELIRYIHLNPVRAKISNDPLDYPLSSHAAASKKYSLQKKMAYIQDQITTIRKA